MEQTALKSSIGILPTNLANESYIIINYLCEAISPIPVIPKSALMVLLLFLLFYSYTYNHGICNIVDYLVILLLKHNCHNYIARRNYTPSHLFLQKLYLFLFLILILFLFVSLHLIILFINIKYKLSNL